VKACLLKIGGSETCVYLEQLLLKIGGSETCVYLEQVRVAKTLRNHKNEPKHNIVTYIFVYIYIH
tara:strand:- start:94 stop:288 length:195 start_codon:yes stop_codon:yes gene_type:complete